MHVAMLFLGGSGAIWWLAGQDDELASRLLLDGRAPEFGSLLAHHLMHIDGWHLAFNALVLLLVGGLLETRWGTPRFLGFSLAMMLGTSLVTLAVVRVAVPMGFFDGGDPVSYGASGLSIACLAVLAVRHRGAEPAGVVSMKQLTWAGIFVAAALMAYLDRDVFRFEPARVSCLMPQVSGVALGFAFLWLEPRCRRRLQAWRLTRLDLARQRVGHIRRRVDELLHKISTEGYGSLTGHEKSFLRQASKHFKNE